MLWRRLCYGLLTGGFLLAAAVSAPADGGRDGPAIHFEQEVFTFQPIVEGDAVEVAFAFANRGGQPLVIQDAVTSCGCTTADYPTHPLRPGKTGTINTTFRSQGHSGDNDIVLLVKSNDGSFPVKKLHIRGKVILQWQIKPDRLVMTNLRSGGNYRKDLRITNYMDEPLQINEFETATDRIRLVSLPEQVPPGEERLVELEVRPKGIDPGQTRQSSVRIEVANARVVSVEIPVLMRVK